MTNQYDPKKEQERQELRELLGGNNYERSWSEAGNDLKQSLKSGGVGAVNAVLGLANLQSKGQAGKNFQERVWDTHKTQQEIQAKKSDTSKMQQRQFENAEGFGAKLGTVLKNPLMAVDATVESLPSMLAGGVMGRAVGGIAGIGSGVARGAIGEGMAMAGSAAENLRSQNKDGLLTGRDYVASVGTGVGGAGLGYAGGKLAQKLGISDVDTMVAGGVRNTIKEAKQNATKGGIGYGLAGIGKGAIAEGVFEELPQTILETGLENWAKGRSLTENMAGNAALGLVSGGMMGGVAGGASSNWRKPPTPDTDSTNNQTDSTPQPPDNGGNTPLSPDGSPISPTSPNNPNSPNSPDNGNGGVYFDMPHNENQAVGFHGNPVIDTPATGLQNPIEHTPLDTQAEQTDTTAPKTEPISQVGQTQQATPDVPQIANGQDVASEPTPQNTPLADVNPQTFANPQNFDSWLNQEEFVNQYKVQQELNAQKPSEQMGLDPNQGSLTRSAVVAVDSGATQAINPQAGVVAGATQAQEGTLARASMQSEPLSAYQTQLQERTAQQEVQAQEAKAVFANAPKLIGKQNYIQNQNERLPTQIMAVEADSLMPSVDNTTNQARDRSRTASRVQVDNIANNLDPMQLTDSTVMGHGSPTISDDGTIIAGNGRTMAIKQAYLQGKADEYRQMLMERADEYGLDKTALAGMKNPVLVKSVGNVGADKLRQLALNSNETGTMTQSAFENARADVERVANINLNQLKADERGDINTSSNRHIINEFVSQFPIEQQNAMRTSNGVLSKQGLERFENALLLSAYGDNPTTQAILESTDEEVRNAVKAIVATSPTVAKTKQGIQDGIAPNDDIASDITEALSMLAKLRREGVKPSDYLAQTNLFGDELSPTGQRLLAFMDENLRSVVKIRQLLYKYYDNLSQENLKQDDMFGKETQTKQSRLNEALQELGHDQFVQPTTATTTATAEQARPASQASQVNERPEKSVSDEQGIGRDDGRVTDGQTAKSKTKQKPKNALDANKDKRVKKAQEKADTQLRQDWGVSMIGNFETTDEFPADFSKENSDPVKEAFLKDSEDYLKIVQHLLEGQGYSLYNGKNGKPEKISVGHDEVTLIMHKERVNIYVKISVSPIFTGKYGEKKHPQNVHILYRVSKGDYSNRHSAGSNNFNQATLTAGELAQKLDELVQREIFRDKVDFTKSINDNAIKNLTNEQAQAVLDMFNGKEVDKSVFDNQAQNTATQTNKPMPTPATPQNAEQAQDDGDVVSKLGLDRALFEKLKSHHQQGGDWNEFNLFPDLKNSADKVKATAEYEKIHGKTPNKIELAKFLKEQVKQAIDNASGKTDNKILNNPLEQQNAITNRAQSSSDRILADTPSDSVGANGNSGATSSVHSKSDKSSAGRDTNQSTNGDDSERSSGVLSDGAKTGVSKRVNADFVNHRGKTDLDTLYRVANSRSDGNKSFTNVAKVNDETAQKIQALTGIDVVGFDIGIDESSIRHTLKEHGDEVSERKRGQTAIVEQDFGLVADIVNNADEIKKGDVDNTLIFEKKLGNTYVVVQELRIGKRKLSLKTMYKKGLTSVLVAPDQSQSTAETPETSGSLALDDSLAKSDNDVNIQTTAQALDNALSATNQADFALSDDMVQTGSVKDKLATNIAIIELLQTLKQENRQPTNDEKALMAKYTGFGGLSNAFPDSQGNYKKGFETLGEKLKNLLSRSEYDNARASSTSAFFTPPSVINAMWDIATRLGYNGGVVLEPSAGVGAFIGHAPKNLPQNIIGAEIDPTTHAITGYLYPHAKIFNQGYETLSVPDNSVDLAIGNPPYGGVRLNFKDKPHLSGKTIANSFMQGTLEQVKPSGLSVMVVSSSFMDSTDASTRKVMAQLGELVGAVRLPNTTFDEAGTAVVADILVFKKHDESTLQAYKDGTKTDYPSWVESGKRTSDDGTEVNFNPYFDDKIAGEFEFGTGEGGRAVYTVKETGSLDKALDKFVKSFAKVKPTRTAKEIEADINKHAQAMVDSLTLEASGESAGFIGRENGVLVQVIEQEDGNPNANRLVKRPLTPASVWSDSFMQDLDGRWYKLEDKKDANGKAVKAKDKEGKPLRINEKTKVYYDEKDISAQSKLGVKGMNVLNQALEIQGLIENQLRLEQGGASDTDIENNRKELNGAYDEFVKTFGFMNNPSNAKYISKLPKANFILALETGYKKQVVIGTGKNKEVTEPETAGKADILSKRVLVPKTQKTHADSPKDALSLSLAYTGGVDLGLMSALTNQSIDELTDALTQSGELFFDPASDSYVVKDEYLSGNIRQKLANAREHGLTNNIAELEKVLPQDVPIENISIRLGMNWLPTKIYSEFAQKLLDNPNATIDYEPLTHSFSVNGTASHTAMNEFSAGGKSPEWILDKILNSKQIRVTQTVDKKTVLLPAETQEANDMAKTIKAEFENFIYSHPEIDKIAKLYNEKHNAIVPRRFDGSHLELIGKVPDDVIKLRTHQKNAVWRGVTTNAVLYDHAVGSGKTFTGIARAMERKRLGLSKKPVLVVPNHMVEQFAQDIYRLYPSANILTAGQKDFAKAKRKRLFGQIATGDYDIIVLPHSSFEFIKLSKERQKIMLEQERDKLMDAIAATKAEQGKRENVKQLEQAKKNIETKLAKLAETKRHDDEFSFEQMGIDDITVDEAHEFKNLFFTTKMQGVKGLGSPAGSNKAMDLWLKTQYLHQTNGSVAFMTGTPISNSAAEMHAVMRYLMPNTLDDMGLDNFDAWANTYAENVAKFEATESGQLKLATRFAREWQNMGSLMSLWKSVTDSVTNDDIKKTYKEETGKEFPLPQVDGGTRKSVVVKPTAQQEQILQMILAGFAKIEAKALDKDEAGKLRLQLMDLATKNALDPRTINPSLNAGGKIGAVVDNVFDVYQKWQDDKGTQIIFLDRSTPKGKGDDKKIMEYEALLQRRENAIQAENDGELLKVNDLLDKYDENEMAELVSAKNGGFSAYDEIKKGLIAKGISADEIAFIQEAETDDEKRELFDQVNAGRVRIIIGSSQRMGAGTNIQKRLVALHHMDAPWKPSDIEQREGRIIRQGNELYAKYGHDNFKVQINAYVTEKTADAKRWDTMSAKLGTINAIRHYNGEHTLDFQEDEENSSFQEIAALATGNPLMRERVELTVQKEQLERQRLSHQKRDAGNRTKLAEAKRQAQSLPVKIKSLETAQAEYEALLPQAQAQFDKVGITIDGQWFSDRKSAGEYLDNKAKQAQDEGKKVSYVIDGESVGGLSAATQKVRESEIGKKGTTPTLITVGKQTYANANEAINDTVISQVNQHHNDVAIAKLMGFDVRSYDMGKNTLLAVETADGYELTNTTLDHHATREKVENAFARLANNLQKNMGNALSNAQNQLKVANDTISQLEGKTGQAFAGEQELKDISERLNEVQALLSDDDSENAFADDEKFDDLLELLDSRAIGGKTGKAFVPKANYDISTFDDSDDVGETDFADIDEVDYDELTPSQQKAVDALNTLPDSDPNKATLLQEVYALDRSDSDTAKQERSKIAKKATTYELVARKTSEVANELKALGYTVKTSKITPTDDGYTANITASKDGRKLDIRVHRMMNERRANDPTKNGFFVNDDGVAYSFSINEPSIAQGIDTYHEYKTDGNYGTNNRPQLTYTDGTDWQQKMRPEIARLMDDDPRLDGFVAMANNEKLAGSYKNEILLALTAYADKQAVRGNALYPHNVGIDGTVNHSERKERQLKQDKPYFGDDRPTFVLTTDKGKAKDWQERMAGQLARLFDDDPRLAEFTEKAGTASPLKQAMVLNELKDHASRQAEQGNALFAFEVIERQNERYHGGEFKFSKQGSRYGTTADEVLDALNKRFGKDTVNALLKNGSLDIISLKEAKKKFGNIPDNADGFYVNGTAYLIHDNIHPDMIIPTFLHELGGHGGLQTLMSDTAYQGFMREFDNLVASGDKLAVKAKALADKHSKNKAEAQSEYLPYLITLASRQKENQGKLKSLINRMMMAIRTFVRQKLGVSLPVTPDEIVLVAEKAVRERANDKIDSRIHEQMQFSKSALKSVSANIKRGKEAITKAITEKTSVHRAMYRNDIGWIDFIWGDTGKIRPNGKTRGAMGLSHIFDSRTRKDGMSYADVVDMFLNETVETIAKGQEYDRFEQGGATKLKILYNKHLVTLVKSKGSNAWMLTAFEIFDDETGKGYGKTSPTHNQSYSARTDVGASNNENIISNDNTLDNLDIQFSRMADFWENNTDKAKETVEKLGKVASDFIANPKSFVKQGASNAKADHLGKFLQLLGRRQLTDLYGKKLQGLKEYNDRVAQMDADSNETSFRADQLVNKWAKVKDSEQLAELMHDVTLTGIDPTAPIKGAKNAKHAQLKARYDRLSDMAKEVFNQAKDDYQTHYENLHRAMVERIQRNDKLSDERKAKLIDELDKELQASKKAFFPLTRFGDYVVVMRDTDGNVVNVARAETKGQADEVRRQLIKDNPNHKVGQVTLGRDVDVRRLGGIKGLASEFLADDLGLDDKLHQDYLNALLDRGFATNNVMIKNTAGFSQNARRAYAHHMSRGSHHIAKLRHTDRLKADLERMQAYIDNQDDDVIELQRVMDELNKRHALLLNPPTHPVSSLATAVGFMWYMGLSPASALVNLSQTLLVAMPMMSAKYGFAKSNKMLGEISALLAKNKNDLSNALTGNEKKAFDEAVRRGVIDMTQAHDLAGVANGENSAVMETIKPVMKVASFMFHHAEKFNRQVTFVASYRLAVQKGLTSEQAMEEAIKITYDGHFDYASSNRPRFMQGNWQRVLFLFKQYGQNMVYTLARNTYLSFKGETPQERAEARKIMAGILAGHAMSAGVLGLPLVTTLLAIASALGGDDDEPWDAEVALRNQLANLLTDDVAEVIAKGMPRAVGADLSSRVGLDSLILPRLQDGLEGQRLGENLIVGLAGPVMNIPVSMTKGMGQIGQGQTLQGVENMIPKALRDPLKAYRYATQGNVDKSGIEIVERENVGISDIAQQAIGFRSGKFAKAQEVKSAIYQADKELTGIRKSLVDSYARAYRDGDTKRADEIWERIKRFNEKNPSVRITKPALMKSIRERNRRIENAKDGIYLSKNREYLRDYGAFGVD
ncbi:PLxRFG domain-containing protein [Moraxella bovis]|uniref:PLxRFG domain-containing protein n=1 Tax=Moraxella bovis TaxID=476 RepID=A0ABY6M321_MORBO|nr:PLxRFG domain-containing protein [Moraxella bovis]UZA02094.1 PLxRFG domain-containing protein [Moraxella bovis]UZA18340.1 PLxRFG domain-containing protein [Moraxella bovis]